ncbi:hypothetical protein [Roseburia intestinalis]
MEHILLFRSNKCEIVDLEKEQESNLKEEQEDISEQTKNMLGLHCRDCLIRLIRNYWKKEKIF